MRVTRLKLVKKIGLAVLLSVAMLFFFYGVASANFGPHGGYEKDTDACAGCHRAHTAVSAITITWTPPGKTVSPLLIGNTASTLREFCYSCHGEYGAGAATNVQSGVYDNSEARVGSSWPSSYNTNSDYLGVLNGGGFDDMGGALPPGSMTSWHEVGGTASGTAWGGGTDGGSEGGTVMLMDCASCHDPHGSSNYRILKDTVNSATPNNVGGYEGDFSGDWDPDPKGWVISNEEGYPIAGTTEPFADPKYGFRLHVQWPDYKPDYTTARYARSPDYRSGGSVADNAAGPDPGKGMSGWCAACHTQYNTQSSLGQGAYNAADGWFSEIRHRHPVNVALTGFYGDRDLLVTTSADGTNTPWPGDSVDIPLEHLAYTWSGGSVEDKDAAQDNTTADWLGCLTCHRAHGTNATMDGYANSASAVNPQPNSGGTIPTAKGVPPAGTSVLLRANNRGVCERCHNK